MEFPSHQIYPSLWKFHVRITPPLGNPEPECPLPHLSPGNSKVNTPSSTVEPLFKIYMDFVLALNYALYLVIFALMHSATISCGGWGVLTHLVQTLTASQIELPGIRQSNVTK
jgi:hypothetical protein